MTTEVGEWRGRNVVDQEGAKVGRLEEVYLDQRTGRPEWMLIHISEEEHAVVLHEEEVVTEKRAIPKEGVRLDKERVTDEQTVSEQVRKEQIDTDGVEKKGRKKRRR